MTTPTQNMALSLLAYSDLPRDINRSQPTVGMLFDTDNKIMLKDKESAVFQDISSLSSYTLIATQPNTPEESVADKCFTLHD